MPEITEAQLMELLLEFRDAHVSMADSLESIEKVMHVIAERLEAGEK